MLNPRNGMTFEFIFSLATFVVLITNVIVMIKNNSKKDAEGVVKANLKLDQLCRDSGETRLDLKSMKGDIEKMTKKQIEHDFRLGQIEKDMDGVCERVTKLEEKGSD